MRLVLFLKTYPPSDDYSEKIPNGKATRQHASPITTTQRGAEYSLDPANLLLLRHLLRERRVKNRH